jgi:hypothetical protein
VAESRKLPPADEEDSTAEFEGLHERLAAEPVSQSQADARVNLLLEQHLNGRTGRLTFNVDPALPPETVIRVEGSTITMSMDAWEALKRHEKRTGKRIYTGKMAQTKTKVLRNEPYKGS